MFKIYDFYKGRKQLVGEFNTYDKALQVAREFIMKTDGECDLDIVADDEFSDKVVPIYESFENS